MYICHRIGEMAEWSNAAVLKTVEGHTSGGSNPSFSALKKVCTMDKLSSFKSSKSQTANTDPASMHKEIKFLAAQIFVPIPKTCKFLFKYDYTYWSDKENYSSDFSSIRFVNLNNNFISFYNTDSDISYCEGWKKDM